MIEPLLNDNNAMSLEIQSIREKLIYASPYLLTLSENSNAF